jgi:hypothetical protein
MGFLETIRTPPKGLPVRDSKSPGKALVAASHTVINPTRIITPREQLPPLTASSQRVNLKRAADIAMMKDRPYVEWQRESWGYYDSIGQIKFPLLMLANITSRVRLFPAVDIDPGSPPTSLYDLRKRELILSKREAEEDAITDLDIPEEITDEVQETLKSIFEALEAGPGGIAGLLKAYSLNMRVAGECYLCKIDGRWSIRSSEEITVNTDNVPVLQPLRSGGMTSAGTLKRNLPLNTYIGRIWNAHPRYSMEPDSSMMSIRELCDELLTLQRTIRAIARSQMHAGGLFIPDGVSASANTPGVEMAEEGEQDINELEVDPLEHEFMEAFKQAVADEAAMTTIMPVIMRGAANLGDAIKKLDLSRPMDKEIVERAASLLNGILEGLDAPKEMVSGLDKVSYRNAEVITEQLFRSHIEPDIINFVSSINSMMVRPLLKAKHKDLPDDIIGKLGIWYSGDTVTIDPAARDVSNDGFDKYLISGDAWRQRNGFSDTDAPSEDELATRMALANPVPPEQASQIMQHAIKSVLDEMRQNMQEQQLPPEARQLLGLKTGQQEPKGAAVENAGSDTEADELIDSELEDNAP